MQWFLTLPKLYRTEFCYKIFVSLPFKGASKSLENKWTEFIQLLNYLCYDSLECLHVHVRICKCKCKCIYICICIYTSHWKFIIYHEKAIGCEFWMSWSKTYAVRCMVLHLFYFILPMLKRSWRPHFSRDRNT